MSNDRLRTALGFCAKAGKCISGDFAAERAVKDRRAMLVALDSGVSAATRERYEGLCERAGIPCVYVEELGKAIGKENRMIAAVKDAGFARMIDEAYRASQQK